MISMRCLCEYPYRAKRAFETMDTHASIRSASERLGLYSRYIAEHGPRILAAFSGALQQSALWDALDRLFMAMIVDRYEADIAFSFLHSLRRNIDPRPLEAGGLFVSAAEQAPGVLHGLGASAHADAGGGSMSQLLCEALQIPDFCRAISRSDRRCAQDPARVRAAAL